MFRFIAIIFRITLYVAYPFFAGMASAKNGEIKRALLWQLAVLSLPSINFALRNYAIYYSAISFILFITIISTISNIKIYQEIKIQKKTNNSLRKVIALTITAVAPFAILITHTESLGISLKRVDGSSMSPTIQHGQWILVDHWSYKVTPPREGEIVVYTPNEFIQSLSIKRVISIDSNGRYILIGDNQGSSNDSRHHGAVHVYQIQGRAFAIPYNFHSSSSRLRKLKESP